MLDQKLQPWMLEVNSFPSFSADTDIDSEIKRDLIANTLKIIQLSVQDRKRLMQEMKIETKL